jgi:hypothetical protein
MGTEFLVACLWVVVLAYWFWSRLPARSDTAGVYRRALRVLEHSTPVRVAPAYRLHAPAIPSAAAPLAAVALCHKRAQLRRRRRDTLSVLLGAVVVTFAAALLTRSGVALAAQLVCDLALAAYVSLLVRAARASIGVGVARRNAAVVPQAAAVHAPAIAPDWPAVYADWRATEEPVRLRAPVPEAAPLVTTYVPAHALRSADLRVVTNDADVGYADGTYGSESYGDESYGDESYGDFDSYASLALASAR